MPVVGEPHRATAIRLLASVAADGIAPGERELRIATAIVDNIAAHSVETVRAILRAEEKLKR